MTHITAHTLQERLREEVEEARVAKTYVIAAHFGSEAADALAAQSQLLAEAREALERLYGFHSAAGINLQTAALLIRKHGGAADATLIDKAADQVLSSLGHTAAFLTKLATIGDPAHLKPLIRRGEGEPASDPGLGAGSPIGASLDDQSILAEAVEALAPFAAMYAGDMLDEVLRARAVLAKLKAECGG